MHYPSSREVYNAIYTASEKEVLESLGRYTDAERYRAMCQCIWNKSGREREIALKYARKELCEKKLIC